MTQITVMSGFTTLTGKMARRVPEIIVDYPLSKGSSMSVANSKSDPCTVTIIYPDSVATKVASDGKYQILSSVIVEP